MTSLTTVPSLLSLHVTNGCLYQRLLFYRCSSCVISVTAVKFAAAVYQEQKDAHSGSLMDNNHWRGQQTIKASLNNNK